MMKLKKTIVYFLLNIFLYVLRFFIVNKHYFHNQGKCYLENEGFPGDSMVKNPPANAKDMVQSLGWEGPMC